MNFLYQKFKQATHLTLLKANPRQTNPFVRDECFMRQITTFYNNLRLPSKLDNIK